MLLYKNKTVDHKTTLPGLGGRAILILLRIQKDGTSQKSFIYSHLPLLRVFNGMKHH